MKRAPLNHEKVFSNQAYAEAYAKQHKLIAAWFGRRFTRTLIARGFRKGRVLDMGCGDGTMNLTLAAHFVESEFLGVDLSDALLNLARETTAQTRYGARVSFEKADVCQLPCTSHSVDVVLNVNMVHLIDNPIRMLDEIERVLVPGGILLLADLRRSGLGWLDREIKSGLTLSEARSLFRQSKLRCGTFSWGVVWWHYVV